MKKKITTSKNYFHDIILCDDILTALKEELNKSYYPKNVFYIVDSNVDKYWGFRLKSVLHDKSYRKYYFTIKATEKNKSQKAVLDICEKLMETGFGRDTVIVSIGGGVTGDIAGFAASVYMRGVKWINIPTTLLSMVDASLGGKTGVNFNNYKNILGTFKQPDCIITDQAFLSTLSMKEYRSGFGEILKYAFLINEEFLEVIQKNLGSLIAHRDNDISDLLEICIMFKASVVYSDEKESGIRKILNLGHTTAHALENVMDFKISHGEAVVSGLAVMLVLSLKMKFITEIKFNSYFSLVKGYKLPAAIHKADTKALVDAMYKDKKNRDGKINFVLMRSPGNLMVDVPVTEEAIKSAVSEALKLFKL